MGVIWSAARESVRAGCGAAVVGAGGDVLRRVIARASIPFSDVALSLL